MEYDDSGNHSDYFEEEVSTPLHYIFHEIIFILFSIVGICANITIIYVMFHFKRMRTAENIFLANWAIADLCSLILAPSGYRIISIIDHLPLSPEFMCTILHLGGAFQAIAVLFVLLVSIDWFTVAHFAEASKKFRIYYKYVIGTIWMISLVISGISSGYCLADVYTLYPEMLLFFSFCALLLITIVLQGSRAVRKFINKPLDHPTLMLTLTTSFAGCWLLGFIIFVIMDGARLHPIIGVVAECAIFCSSIVIFGLLYRLNKEFQACLLQTLKRSNNKYDDSICSFDNPIVKNMNNKFDNPIVKNANNKDSIQISFHNPDEELLVNEY